MIIPIEVKYNFKKIVKWKIQSFFICKKIKNNYKVHNKFTQAWYYNNIEKKQWGD